MKARTRARVSPCLTPDRKPASARRAPDSSGSASPSGGTCPSGPEEDTSRVQLQGQSQDLLRRVDTFWILVLMVDAMVVGGTNWKVGAALLGYWAGNLTTRWT